MSIIAYLLPVALLCLGRVCRKSRILKVLILIYIWVLMGLNTYTPDYEEYEWIFRHSVNFAENVNVELGYRLICAAFCKLGLSYQQFRMVWAGAYVLILNKAVDRYTRDCNVVLPLFIIWPFISYVSGIRFAMADVIVLYAIPFLFERGRKGQVKYAIFLVLALTIHTSVIFFALFLLARKQFTAKQYLLISAIIFSVSVVLRFSLLDPIIEMMFSGTLAHKLTKWISYSADSGVVHMNIVGFTSNAFFIAAYAFLIYQMTIPIKKNALEHIESCNTKDYFAESAYMRAYIYRNISTLMLVIIPGFIISAEYVRMITGILFVYYVVYDRYRYGRLNVSIENRLIYSCLFFFLTLLYMLFYAFAGQGYNIFATYTDNILFGG